jgi:hypothetical protein
MRHWWTRSVAVTAAAVTLLSGLATTARAELWGIAYGDNILVRINPLTAEAEFIAPLSGEYSVVNFSGLDYMNGTLYANGIFNPDTEDFGLVSIDTVTGATTFLTSDPGDCYALAADPDANLLYSLDDFSDVFFAYDVANGYLPTPFGIPDPPVDFIDGAAYAYGLFWGVDAGTQELYSINLQTGERFSSGIVSDPGNPGVNVISDNAGLTWDDGILYLAAAPDGFLSALYSLNPLTAEATLIGQITSFGDGLTIDGLAGTVASAAPEPGSGMLILSMLLTVGAAVRRRRRVAARY